MQPRCVTFCLIALPLLALPLFAQDRAAINGTVSDPSGAVVVGAAVQLAAAETGLRRSSLTDEGGRYQISTLPVGIYTLTMSKPGFKSTTVDHIDLQYGETRTIDARLEIGATTESV